MRRRTVVLLIIGIVVTIVGMTFATAAIYGPEVASPNNTHVAKSVVETSTASALLIEAQNNEVVPCWQTRNKKDASYVGNCRNEFEQLSFTANGILVNSITINQANWWCFGPLWFYTNGYAVTQTQQCDRYEKGVSDYEVIAYLPYANAPPQICVQPQGKPFTCVVENGTGNSSAIFYQPGKKPTFILAFQK